MAGFIFGGENMPRTPQELEQMRSMALAMGRRSGTPQNFGEGLSSIGDAILYRAMSSRADKAEKSATDASSKSFADFASDLFGPATTPDTAPDTATTNPVNTTLPPVEGTMENARTGDRASVQNYAGLDLKSGIRSAADSLGVKPEDLATAISYETAGTFDPTKDGPTTKWGKHRGLIQFGEPQAEKYGVNWNDPLQSQLGPDGAVVKYLRDTGVKPGASLMDIYSAINAGGVNRENASDEANGGAPGTVADKVNHQMDGHRQKALALFADPASTTAFDAQSNLNKDASVVPVPDGFEQADPMEAKPKATVRVAQAMSTVASEKASQAMTILNDPWATPGQKAVAQTFLKRHLDQQDQLAEEERKRTDPKYKLDLEKSNLELENLRNPKQARRMSDAEEKDAGLPVDGVYQVLPDGTYKTIREPAKPADALNIEKTTLELEKLKNPEKATELTADQKKALGLPPDGVYQRKADGSIVTVREPEKATNEWSKLDGNRLFNQKTGIIKDATSDKVVGFRFPGSSTEAAALNGLIDSGKLTEEQAMNIAAGKQLSGPNGEIMFATPQALIGAQQQPATQDGGIDIFAGGKTDPAQVVDPAAVATETPADVLPAIEQPNTGMIPLTAPKVTIDERKAATFADRMTQSGAILDNLENFAAKPDTKWDQTKAQVPLIGNFLTSEDFKKFDNAKRDFINAQLRRESGAVISDSEFANAEQQYFPQPNDPPDVVAQKRALRKTVLDGMMRDAGPTYKAPTTELPTTKADEDIGPAPENVEPEIWKHMTPEERALWPK